MNSLGVVLSLGAWLATIPCRLHDPTQSNPEAQDLYSSLLTYWRRGAGQWNPGASDSTETRAEVQAQPD